MEQYAGWFHKNIILKKTFICHVTKCTWNKSVNCVSEWESSWITTTKTPNCQQLIRKVSTLFSRLGGIQNVTRLNTHRKGHLLYVVATEMGRAHAALVCIWLQSHVKVTSCHQVLLCVCAHERDLSSYTAVSRGISWCWNIPRHGTDGGLLSPHDIFSIGTMVIVFVHILGLRLCAGNDSDISLVEAAFYQSGCSVFCVCFITKSHR